LRYLELGDFRLVREALRERETLMRIAPHLVSALLLPRAPAMPAWQIRAGLLCTTGWPPQRLRAAAP
jgi:glycerol-3-phosphate dehydrogenase